VTELFRPISQYRMLIYGAVLVVIMVLRPEGIMGNREFVSWVKAPFRRRA
ncbi:MAG TPA: branched-chain amino acid ABC transporter permease, partial [Aminivibrio sp.]|nr:branched-chain amino acid ABC transporter permease [Aminivibrio sp.]